MNGTKCVFLDTKASSKWLFTYLTLKLAAKPDQVQAICVHATMDRSKVICTLTETSRSRVPQQAWALTVHCKNLTTTTFRSFSIEKNVVHGILGQSSQ